MDLQRRGAASNPITDLAGGILALLFNVTELMVFEGPSLHESFITDFTLEKSLSSVPAAMDPQSITGAQNQITHVTGGMFDLLRPAESCVRGLSSFFFLAAT